MDGHSSVYNRPERERERNDVKEKKKKKKKKSLLHSPFNAWGTLELDTLV
jgi:hypothetical protein